MTVNQSSLRAGEEGERDSFERASVWERLALFAGIAFVALLFITIADAPEPPAAWAGDVNLKDWLTGHKDIFLTNALLRSVAAFSMLVFICGVVSRIRRARGRLGMMSLLAVCGAVAFTLVMFISQMADATAAMFAASGGGAEAVRALAALGDTMRHFNALSGALMIGSVSAALLRARVVPRVVCWFGFAAALLFLAGAAGFPGTRLEFLNSTVALPLVPLWPLVLSITLLARSGRKREAGAESPD
jgi:hypothetical protein